MNAKGLELVSEIGPTEEGRSLQGDIDTRSADPDGEVERRHAILAEVAANLALNEVYIELLGEENI